MSAMSERDDERAEIDAYFTSENEDATSRCEYPSPSGRYKLVVSSFGTKPGSWSYSQGKVFKQGSDAPIAIVNRNYSAFPYMFVEDHPSGHDFLVCGEDYQGQTVIDLTTGARRDHLSAGTDKGFGFCWAEHRFHKETQVLVVCGCHWACPYEFRFYDFADPMKGWPEFMLRAEPKSESASGAAPEPETEIKDLGGIGMYDDAKWPTFEPDGTIRCYQTEDADNDDDYVNKPKPEGIAAHTTFRREGSKLVSLGEWVSEGEKKRRAAREEGERKYEAWKEDFKKTDSLYLAYDRLVKDSAFSPEDHMSIGVIHDSWCPHYKSEGCKERRWCRRIVTRPGDKGLTIDLEWGVDAGPIKLVIYRNGSHEVDEFFDHSAAEMERAFARVKSYVSGEERA